MRFVLALLLVSCGAAGVRTPAVVAPVEPWNFCSARVPEACEQDNECLLSLVDVGGFADAMRCVPRTP
jgi:hypothetical protein